ncbi:MAG: substrate-binding domain-containing protein [Pseudomonadota bacterium]
MKFVLSLASLFFFATNLCASEIKMATTTSTEASGLLGLILPQFEKATGIKVKVISVGTGQALKLGERGDVDVVLVHSRPDEDKYMAAGFGTERRDVMYNDFIIVGPKDDPAKLRGEKNAATALKKLAAAQLRFVSRGDDSGTHKKELSLWRDAMVTPNGRWYMQVGQGMGETLTIAGNLRAYTLADRGTFLAHRARVGLDVIVSEVPGLYNPYGIMDVNPAKHPHAKQAEALKLIDWIISPRGQAAILSLKVDGASLFTPGSAPKD